MTRKRLFDLAAKLRDPDYKVLNELAEKIDVLAENHSLEVCEDALEAFRTV